MHPGDFNNDGLTDFVWVSSIPLYIVQFGSVKNFFFQINGLANGEFTAPILIGHDDDISFQATGIGSTNFLVADMNNDGYDDFVAIGNSAIEEYYGSSSNNMSLINSISTSSVFPTYFSMIGVSDYTLEQYYSAAAVDIQGDGFPEIIIPGQGILSNNNGVLGNYMNFANIGSSSYTLENVIEAQDMDNNGLIDLVLEVNLGNTTRLFYQNSINTFEEVTIPINIVGMNYGPKHKPFHDINNDGLLDVIGYNNFSLSTGNNTYSAPLQLNSQVIDVRDENGDGYLDIIVTSASNDYYSDPFVMINDGTGHFNPATQLPQPSLSVFCHYDHDHDGDLDLFG
jgi:hypothetical protein